MSEPINTRPMKRKLRRIAIAPQTLEQQWPHRLKRCGSGSITVKQRCGWRSHESRFRNESDAQAHASATEPAPAASLTSKQRQVRETTSSVEHCNRSPLKECRKAETSPACPFSRLLPRTDTRLPEDPCTLKVVTSSRAQSGWSQVDILRSSSAPSRQNREHAETTSRPNKPAL